MKREFDESHWTDASDEHVVRMAAKGFKGAIKEQERRGLDDDEPRGTTPGCGHMAGNC